MTNFFQNFLKPSWWFSSPAPLSSETKILFFTFLILVISSFVCYVIFTNSARRLPPYEGLKNLTFGWLLGFGLIGLFFVFLIWQSIPYLSLRIVMVLFGWVILTWLANLVYFVLVKFRKQLKVFHQEANFKKYLPKSGKKRR